MPYQATVYNVMIASPGDVQEERNIVRQVIHEWNDIHSEKTKITLRPVGWETSTSPITGGRAQDIINTQILNNSDLLVAIFWTRLGTPTGNSESGTAEELKKHIEAGKPAMIYFSEERVAMKDVDQAQYNRLLEFKSWCEAQGLIASIPDREKFKESFSKQLQILVNKYLIHESFPQDESTPPVETQPNIEISLSKEAKIILKDASDTTSGQIARIRFIGGMSVETSKGNYIIKGDHRSKAKWDSAVDELESLGLIKDIGYKGELFQLTSLGYEVADSLPENEKT